MIDREPIMRLSLPGPVKRSRATLESDPPRDNRTGWRRMSTRGSRFPLPHPTATKINIQSFPPCLINSGGVGAEPPRTVAERQCSLPGDSSLFAEGKIPFHAEPRQNHQSQIEGGSYGISHAHFHLRNDHHPHKKAAPKQKMPVNK